MQCAASESQTESGYEGKDDCAGRLAPRPRRAGSWMISRTQIPVLPSNEVQRKGKMTSLSEGCCTVFGDSRELYFPEREACRIRS